MVCERFYDELLKEYNLEHRPRYYVYSNTHRKKNRILQAMLHLMLYPQSKGNLQKLFDFAENVLLVESSQHSVRYQIEILLTNIYLENPDLIFELGKSVAKFQKERLSAMTSIISVLYHLIKRCVRTYAQEAMKVLIPMSMSSMFAVRLYAQVSLKYYPFNISLSKLVQEH